MSLTKETSFRLLLIAVGALAIGCSASLSRRSHRVNRYDGNHDDRRMAIVNPRGNRSRIVFHPPTDREWVELCNEANCLYFEECRRTSDFLMGQPGPDGFYRNTTSYWEAICTCEYCDVRKEGESRYGRAVCASNMETFWNDCWFRRCKCLADRMELTEVGRGQCGKPIPVDGMLPKHICPGEPKGYDDKSCCSLG